MAALSVESANWDVDRCSQSKAEVKPPGFPRFSPLRWFEAGTAELRRS